MKKISIIILLMICLSSLLLTGCKEIGITPGIDSENLENQGDTNDTGTVSNINIDKTPPVVTITLPGTGEYVLNQSITATWSATDALSGVASPVSGTVSIDTSSVGTKTFTLPVGTVKDKAGNSSLKVTKSYSVIADTEEPIIVDPEDPEMVYPQQWATGDGTAKNPWANSCIESAYTACPAGGTVYLRAGYYQLAGRVDITKQINIIGEGIDKTIIKTADAHGLHVNEVDYVTIKGLTVDGDAQTTGAETYRYCIGIGRSNYITLEDIEVKNGSRIGIDANNNNHLLFTNIYAHDITYSHGIHPGGDIIGRNMSNTYRDIYCWDNGKGGFDDSNDVFNPSEVGNIYDNLQCWDNGTNGIVIVGHEGGILSNSFVSGNRENGIYLTDAKDFNIHDCYTELNGEEGVEIIYSENVSLTNVIIKSNNVSDTASLGASCFPKDTEALCSIATSYGYEFKTLQAVISANKRQRELMVEKIKHLLGDLKDKTIGVLGLAFKQNTDDIRKSPSIDIIKLLLKEDAHIRCFDPLAMENAKKVLPDIIYCENEYEAALESDALVVATEWNQFRNLDLFKIKKLLKSPILLDLRNLYEPAQVKELGFIYEGVGRK